MERSWNNEFKEIQQSYEFGYQKIKVIEDINYMDSNYSDITWLEGWERNYVEEKVQELLEEYKRFNTYPKVYYKIWMRPIGLVFVKDVE